MHLGHDPEEPKALKSLDSRHPLSTWAFGLFVGAVLVLAFLRLTYGVDFVDEATYVAVPYRFCLGDTPFVDEHTPIQTSGLITLPFIEIFHWIRGSADGLVLYTRVLYYVFCCGVATAVAFGLRPMIGMRGAVLVSLACVVFCPLSIPNLSYNTLSSGFFTVGIFVALQHLLWNRSLGWLALAGWAHGMAGLALPSYGLPNLCFVVAAAVTLAPKQRWRGVLLYAAGGVAALVPFAHWLSRFDAETLDNAYFHVHTAEGWTSRVTQFANQAWWFIPFKLELALVLAGLWVATKYRLAWLSAILTALLPLAPLLLRRTTHSLWYVTLMALCSTLFLVLSWRTPLSRRLAWCVWLPALCAGATGSITSLNGLVNSGLGLFPILLMGMALAVILAREAAEQSASPFLAKLELAFPVLVVAALLGYQRRPFGEDPVSQLDTRITFGPYAGLKTISDKEIFLRTITEDLSAAAREHRRVLFVDHFPAGYLITDMRPAPACIWTYPCTGGPFDDCLRAMRRDIERSERPDSAVFRMHAFPLRRNNMWQFDRNDLDRILEERFEHVVDRPGYSVFVGR